MKIVSILIHTSTLGIYNIIVEQTECHAVMDLSWILLLINVYVSLFYEIPECETLTLKFWYK